jgi:hypothetical protein
MGSYDGDILDGFSRRTAVPDAPTMTARLGLIIEHRRTGFTGSISQLAADGLTVKGRTGAERVFAYGRGAFLVQGQPVTLVRAVKATSPPAITLTASGSIAATHSARVAEPSRIWVEGLHDAALVERVWGDDLRQIGVVVEPLGGIDDLAADVAAFAPGPGKRLGVLVDHLVAGSKETRIVDGVRHPHVLVTGTPFVDIWQAIRPSVAGIERWPTIDRGTDWKMGICAELGVGDPGEMWRRLLARVTTYADLESELVGAVEQLIDFVTEPQQ